MLGFLNKLFGGSKSEKDIKKLSPEVSKANAVFANLQSLSNDDLRAKTIEFKQRIKEHIKEIEAQIHETNQNAEAQSDIYAKDAIYKEVDLLLLERNKQLEVVLDAILPEAFAVVKEAAARFTNNAQLNSTATDLDRFLATKKAYVKIEGNQSIFNNTWLAAGGQVSWNMIHYDVQLIGGTVLHQGKIAEMATGEGKTLVSTLPVYLNALAGLGVHLVTVNDYLARRDSEWNGTLFEWLGLTVDCIDKHQPNSEERRNAYLADITYGTNNEFGFDYLRDNMVHSPSEMVQRKHHYAIVDEVDSVLIDDARTPLIISGPVPKGDEQEFHLLKPRIEKIVEVQKRVANQSLVEAKKLIAEGKDDKDAGGLMLYRAYKALPKNGSLIKFLSEPGIKQILQKTENYYLGEQQRNMPIVDSELYFVIDEKNNSVDLTQKGLQLLSTASEEANFFVLPDISVLMNNIDTSEASTEDKTTQKAALLQEYSVKADRIHTVQQLLKAYTLFDIDVDYVVMDEKVKIVDEQTGRILDGRRYSDGLHQAIEAKENVTIEAATQTFATITLQNYFRMYHKLAGMTGTAETEAAELWSIYKLDVVKVPTNIPIKRNDQEDLIYKTKREKYRAIIDEVKELSAEGRAVLVGTTNVEVSELISKMLTFEKIPHNVLNAKQHAKEAQIVSEAGLTSAITIATNMAGRGTDIKLAADVKTAGGLAIIGTERHDSRRVDRQLRGRAGRQGDPGSSKFYISLEDELMRLFGSERLSGIMDKLGHKEGDVIQHSMITRSIERAQKKVEENNFGIRKRLLEYDDVMNAQRDVIYKRRRNALFGDRLSIDIENAFADVATDLADNFVGSNAYADYKLECIRLFAIEPSITEQDFISANADTLTDSIYSDLKNYYAAKTIAIAKQTLPVLSGIRAQNPNQQIDNVSIPFTDGIHGFNALANLDACLAPNSSEVINALERSSTLALIDDAWKNHLRQMDELKQSVQMSSSTEQKDPLVIYKIEAFNLFKELISTTNKNIVSFLCKAGLPVQQQQDIQEAKQTQTDMRNLRASHETFGDDADEQAQMHDTREPMKQEPIKREEPKIGRNDNCPCGSGKKFKACHGKGM
jgi:preprotein translocase subunit SecA